MTTAHWQAGDSSARAALARVDSMAQAGQFAKASVRRMPLTRLGVVTASMAPVVHLSRASVAIARASSCMGVRGQTHRPRCCRETRHEPAALTQDILHGQMRRTDVSPTVAFDIRCAAAGDSLLILQGNPLIPL